MVVAAFPVAKLGALMLKQISKPLANIAKARARRSPFFRNYVCMPPAQFYHWCEVKLKMWSMNLGKPVNIPKLNEASAIELGAELVGEAFIFTVAAAILIAEYARSVRKEAAKEAERLAQMEQIQEDLKLLYTEKAQHESQIKELIRILEEKIPDSNFSPAAPTEYNIPLHHRADYKVDVEEGPGAFATMKGWVSNAIDFVLPPINNDPPKNESQLVVIRRTVPDQQQSKDNCGCESKPGSAPDKPGSSR